MTKQRRMILKIVLILLCLSVLIIAINKKQPMQIRQPEGTFVRVQDVLNLSRALQEDIKDSAIYHRLEEDYQIDSEALLTYEDYRAILTEMGTQATPSFEEHYRPEHHLLATDWMEAFAVMRAFYDNEGAVRDITVTIAGMEGAVTDGQGEVFSPYQLLTAQGEVYTFASDDFRQYNFQTVNVLCLDRELLYVTGVRQTDTILPNTFILAGAAPVIATTSASSGSSALSDAAVSPTAALVYFFRDHEIRVDLFDPEAIKTNPRTADFGMDDLNEQVADLSFSNGQLTEIAVKQEKINGKLLAVTADSVTVEGHGTYSLAADITVYRLYDSLKTVTPHDMIMGYDFTDFILADGKVTAALLTRKEAMEYIRVAIRTDNFAGLVHKGLSVTADVDYTVTYGPYDARQTTDFSAGDRLDLERDSKYLAGGNLILAPAVKTGKIVLLSLKRSQGTPEYRGTLEITRDDDGLRAVNELLLEEYLYSVVPSEMPASYPLEALKAQAVCARTYAYRYLLGAGLGNIGAHVDDSVGYQVYNNVAENSATTKAVKETTGKMLFYDQLPAQIYYYSTSCGYGTVPEVWKSDTAGDFSYLKATVIGSSADRLSPQATTGQATLESMPPEQMTIEENFAGFITTVRESDFESAEPWYRWTTEITGLDALTLAENLRVRYKASERLVLTQEGEGFVGRPIRDVGDITDIYCVKRLPGGVMDEVVIETTQNTFKVVSENAIRAVLNDGKAKIIRQDGSEVSSSNLLPSAFMLIDPVVTDGIVTALKLTGGGYGHGVGMAQNGARTLGQRGYSDEQILERFYGACEITTVY